MGDVTVYSSVYMVRVYSVYAILYVYPKNVRRERFLGGKGS